MILASLSIDHLWKNGIIKINIIIISNFIFKFNSRKISYNFKYLFYGLF